MTTSSLPGGRAPGDVERQERYWHETLSGDLSVLRLTPDYPRPPVSSFIREVESLDLDQSLYHQLLHFCAEQQCSLKVVLLAAYNTLLHRYTGETDILVGSVAPNCRRWSDLKQPERFTNLLVLRTYLAGNPDFLALLSRTAKTVEEANRHRDYPFEQVLESVCAKQSDRSSKIIHNLFALCSANSGSAESTLQEEDLAEVEEYTSQCDIVCVAAAHAEKLTISCHYDAELFASATIMRVLGHYRSLLCAAVSHPETAIAELPLLADAERHQLLVEWNDTAVAYPKDKCLHELFVEQVERTPDAVAVVLEDQQLTYRQLNRRANQLAHSLQKLGAGPDVLVALCMDRSVETVIGLLAILKAGGAYVPLDPSYPQERLAFMLADTQAPVLLTQQNLLDSLPPHQATALCLDRDWETISHESAENPAVQTTAEHLAYVIYTSGSTGQPKGVTVPHRGIVRLVCGTDYVPFNSAQVFLQLAPISFDAATFELWGALLQGATCALFPGRISSPEQLGTILCKHHVNTLWLTASLFNNLIDQAPEILAGVSLLVAGGEALSVAHVRRALTLLPHTQLINGYGPTESTTFACTHVIARHIEETATSIPIGRPIANTTVYILDPSLTPVPVGVVGELYIGGAGLAWGYLGRLDLTAERFIPDPFSTQPGSRLYRTGDLARYLSDGNIELLGRLDNQVKIRGYRIELGEVEAVLAQHSAVKEAVVIARGFTHGETQLSAYIVCQRESPPTLAEVRTFLKSKLPDYMVPSTFTFLDALPLTANGKVDRHALPAPDDNRLSSASDFGAPRNSTEATIAGIWSEVLGLERVGVDEDFFELGGHSLLVIQVASRLQKSFGVDVPLRCLFETRTIAELGRVLEERRSRQQHSPAKTIARAPRNTECPLSFAQQRLWFLDQFHPQSCVYNIPGAVRIRGPLDITSLERSLNEIIRRHEALRTIFTTRNGIPVQVVSASLNLPVAVVNLVGRPKDEREIEAHRLIGEDIQRPFDLTQGPLLRPIVFQLADDDCIFSYTMHHIVSDAWSQTIFLQELSLLYEAFVTEKPSPLPAPPFQYADYAVWQRQWMQDERLGNQLAYWKEQLSNVPALQLPTDHPRPGVQSFRGAKQSLTLPRTLSDQLHKLSRKEEATLFMTLLAAFHVLLHRYTGQDDVTVGSPIAGRSRFEIEGVMGFFVNTLVFRTDFSGNPRFLEVLKQVKDVALDAYAHQDVPFEKLVEILQPGRDLSTSPLFQVLFVLQSKEQQVLALPGLTSSPIDIDTATAKFDLTLSLKETENGLTGHIEYSTDLFDAATIERMLGHYRTVLEGMVKNPEQQISQFEILTEVERQRLLIEWNDTERDYSRDKCLHELFAAQVERTPEAVAVVFEDQQLTYRELHTRANQLAHYLQKLGVGAETLVGICIERSWEIIVGLLGVLKAGGAYVPLDPRAPTARLAFLLQDARLSVIVTQERLRTRAQQLAVGDQHAEVSDRTQDSFFMTQHSTVCIDSDWEVISQEPETTPDCAITTENLAYVIYTSGSTGKPKGVLIEHQQILNYVQGIQETYGLMPSSSYAMVQPLSVDSSQTVIFPPLISGGVLHIVSEARALDAQAFTDYFACCEIDLLKIAPSHLAALLQASAHADQLLPRHWLIIGGEASRRDWVEGFLATAQCTIFNHYGPTEATVGMLTYRVPKDTNSEAASTIPIGRPLPNTQAYVLDSYLQPVPIGIAGELYISGSCLARGYLNRPELNAEKFIPHPFKMELGARLYKTGDLVRYRPDGNIEFLGRTDHQVKIRGFRVEPAEIEAVLSDHPALHTAVVLARENVSGDKRLVAYLVAPDRQETTVSELRQFLKTRLPDYMMPTSFVWLSALPLTPHGKVDLSALPMPAESTPEPGRALVEPRTTTEELLATIWAEVLKLEKIGIHDNFFDLGGHSLLAAQLISRIRDTFRLELPLRSVFEAPTIAGLAEQIGSARKRETRIRALPILHESLDKEYPLSFSQERFWFLEQLEPNNAAYKSISGFHFTGPLDIEALEKSLAEIVRRHESLRTTFHESQGGLIQLVSEQWPFRLKVIDQRQEPAVDLDTQTQELFENEQRQPFDLSTDLLLRGTLLRLSDSEHVLVISGHHIAWDHWSIKVFFHELEVLYQAFATTKPSPLAELPIQYKHYALWQRKKFHGTEFDNSLAYWREQLANAPASLPLPVDHPHKPLNNRRGLRQVLVLPKELRSALESFSKEANVTLFMTILATFQTLLHKMTGEDDIVVGTPVAGRERSETEGLIGLFLNSLALRTTLSGNPTFRELLARVREVVLGAYDHQELPFEKLVAALQPERDLQRTPLFQVFINMYNFKEAGLELEGLSVRPLAGFGETPLQFDLEFSVREYEDGTHLIFAYDSNLFEAATIQRLLGHVHVLLEGIAANPDHRISELPTLTRAEQQQLLVEWNDTQQDYPSEQCVHRLFEAQVERTPDAVAVEYENRQLTYRELNARANQFAHYLQKLGVGPEVLVGICMGRSLGMVVGLLGVLKAGGAYVPLDPSYPPERLAFMLADTQASVLLTQQALADALPPHHARVLCLDRDWSMMSRESQENLTVPTTAEHLAYVLYTSGSTGQPKGVAIAQRNVAAFLAWVHTTFSPEELSRVLASTSLCFDLSVFELFAPLTGGGTVVVVDNALALARAASPVEVTLLNTVPSAIAELLRLQRIPPTVQTINLAGELLTTTLVDQLYASTAAQRVYDLYGPTECTTYATYTLRTVGGPQTIGRPIQNTQVYVLDAYLHPVPIGVTGEVYIGGDGVARGYLNRPELTAEKFLPDPFSREPSARLYKTGDLARYLPDGNLEFVGRSDHQVKLRGYRIELGEIESVLRPHPAIQDIVVVLREEMVGDKRLVAYLVPAQSQLPPVSELRSFVQGKLPEYMVPSAVVFLDKFPLTPNGKLDRRALQAAALPRPELEETYVTPRSPTEELLAAIWSEILKLEKVGVHDNFFALGGHSLKATQVVARINKRVQIVVPLRAMFECQTIAALATLIDKQQERQISNEALDSILSAIEALSEEDAKALLTEET